MNFCVIVEDRIAGMLAVPECEVEGFMATGETPFCFSHAEMSVSRDLLSLSFSFMFPRRGCLASRRIQPRDNGTIDLLSHDLRFTRLYGYGSRLSLEADRQRRRGGLAGYVA